MLVVVLDNLIEEFAEFLVGIVGSSVGADSRLDVLNSGENAGFEGDSELVTLFTVFVPDLFGQILAAQGLVSLREDWAGGQLINTLEVISSFAHITRFDLRLLRRILNILGSIATHLIFLL